MNTDVIIAGGGVVGLSLATALLQGGLSVALVEASPASDDMDMITPDLRVFALTRASECLFQHLGVWSNITALRISPFRDMHVQDATGTGEIHFNSADLYEPLLGYIAEQKVLLAALRQRLAAFERLHCHQPARVTTLNVQPQQITVQLDNGQVLHSRLLIGAEGVNSTVRQLAGIPYHQYDYGQQAVVANVTTTDPHQMTAWQRFLPSGPLAFLPLCDMHQCSIVWSQATQNAQQVLQLDNDAFCQALGKTFAYRLGDITATGPRAAFSLQRRHAAHYVQPRIALAGDAAHTIHPLAGQGINIGLLDVAALADVLLTAAGQQRDIGQLSVLRRYERWRSGHNHAVQHLMDGFKLLFGSQLPIVRRVRNLGLTLVHHSGPVKTQIMRQAMGLDGDLPPLARAS